MKQVKSWNFQAHVVLNSCLFWHKLGDCIYRTAIVKRPDEHNNLNKMFILEFLPSRDILP